jgi:hypothetical protein
MNKYFVGALIMLGSVLALAAGAQAETGDVTVHLNQAFVAGGKLLPPGNYRILQSSDESFPALIVRSEEPGSAVLVLPTTRGDSRLEQPRVKLTRVGDLYYLSEVSTERGVYTIALPRNLSRIAKAGDLQGMSASGSN